MIEFFECDLLQELNEVSIVFRIVLAMILGGALGLERGRKNRPAGFRTYILVCLGAAVVMMTNQYIFLKYGASDPTRLGAQVISGIGFLGAGTIILTGRNQIKGITTAACLWTAACCGLAIGVGFYFGAIAVGLAVVFVLTALHKIDIWVKRHSKYIELYIEYNSKECPFSEFIQYARDHKLEIENLQITKEDFHVSKKEKKGVSYTLTVISDKKRNHAEIIELLSQAKGIWYIEELQ